MVTLHGDTCGGHYLQWFREQTDDWAALRDPANELPHNYSCPQAYRTPIPEELYPTSYVRTKAVEYLNAHDGKNPFFAFVSFPDPHHPFNPPGKYWDMYSPEDFSVDVPFEAHQNPHPALQACKNQLEDGTRFTKAQKLFMARDQELREAMALSAGMITMIDDAVGELIATLKANGQWDNTVVIFNSDHGDYLGAFNLLLKGPIAHHSINRVPCVIRDPADETETVRDDLCSSLDLAPTLMARAGLDPYYGLHGQDLFGTARRETLLIEHEDSSPKPGFSQIANVRTILSATHRLSLYRGEDWGELYDLQKDPDETNNLWDDPALSFRQNSTFATTGRVHGGRSRSITLAKVSCLMTNLGDELDGVLVVSLEQAVAAPYCGLLLADAGARVIKVERPDGDFARGYDAGADGQSAIFAWLNRGKESICLDLKAADDLAVMREMLRQADVFVSNLAPGAVARMGLGADVLRADNAGLICVSLSGYGDTGPAAQKKAYDFLVQAETGVCSVTGTADNPARVGVSVTDLSTGLTAFSAVLRALIKRGRTGRGTDIHLTMFDVLADWMNMPLLQHRYSGGAPRRSGLQHSFIAPYGAFTCADGQVLLSVQNNREWEALCRDVLGQPELVGDNRFAQNPDRYANRTILDALVNATFSKLPRAEVLSRLDAARIANANLNDVTDLSVHPYLTNAQARIGEAKVEMAALPLRSHAGTPTNVPGLGEHSAALRAEFSTV